MYALLYLVFLAGLAGTVMLAANKAAGITAAPAVDARVGSATPARAPAPSHQPFRHAHAAKSAAIAASSSKRPKGRHVSEASSAHRRTRNVEFSPRTR